MRPECLALVDVADAGADSLLEHQLDRDQAVAFKTLYQVGCCRRHGLTDQPPPEGDGCPPDGVPFRQSARPPGARARRPVPWGWRRNPPREAAARAVSP